MYKSRNGREIRQTYRREKYPCKVLKWTITNTQLKTKVYLYIWCLKLENRTLRWRHGLFVNPSSTARKKTTVRHITLSFAPVRWRVTVSHITPQKQSLWFKTARGKGKEPGRGWETKEKEEIMTVCYWSLKVTWCCVEAVHSLPSVPGRGRRRTRIIHKVKDFNFSDIPKL